MGKASTRARRQAAGGGPQRKGRPNAKGSKGRGSRAGRRGEPERRPLGVVLVAIAAVVLGAGGIVAGLSLGEGGDEEGDPVASAATGAEFHSLALSPVEPRRLFVGGDRAASSTATGGIRWGEIEALRDTGAMSWVLAPEALYVIGRGGLYRSNDGAATFDQVNDGLPSTDVRALGGGANVLYGASPDGGVFAGQPGAWEVRSAEAGRSFVGRIVVDPEDDEHVFAADASAGVAESTDGGRTWRTLDSGLSEATWLSRGGNGLELLVASGPAGAAVSRDGGESWESLDLPEGATLVETYTDESDLLYAGIHDGRRVELRMSIDGGENWVRPDTNNAPVPNQPAPAGG